MRSFLTNTAATVALRNLGLTQTSFGKAQAQISSGLRGADASDQASCWSIGGAMKSRVDTLSTVNAGLDLNKALFGMTNAGINDKPIRAGNDILVRHTVSRNRSCDTTVRYVIIDGQGELQNFGPIAIDFVGTPAVESDSRRFHIPTNAEAGESKLRMVISWSCPGNDLQDLFLVERVQP